MSEFILVEQRIVPARLSFSAAERMRIAALYGFVALLHGLGSVRFLADRNLYLFQLSSLARSSKLTGLQIW
jgi:hypothetical protein